MAKNYKINHIEDIFNTIVYTAWQKENGQIMTPDIFARSYQNQRNIMESQKKNGIMPDPRLELVDEYTLEQFKERFNLK